MKALLAALLMIGPWSTQYDIDNLDKAYARALWDCGIWIGSNVKGKASSSKPNITNMEISSH